MKSLNEKIKGLSHLFHFYYGRNIQSFNDAVILRFMLCFFPAKYKSSLKKRWKV